MSVELRIVTEGECTCGTPYPTGNPPPEHRHHIECDWGRIEYPEPRPDRGEVGHLMLAAASLRDDHYARDCDPEGRTRWQRYGFYRQDLRLFATTAYPIYSPSSVHDEREWIPTSETQYWTWELFPAHFADGKGPDRIYIGRWPD